jgi:hypothetical protein
MSQSEKPIRAFMLSLIAGILILVNAVSVAAAATWFPWLIPTLPGSSSNDVTILYSVAAVGLICGVLVLFGAIMLHSRPEHKRAWGIMVIVSSIPSIVTGGGFIIGFILGIIGGAYTLSRKPKTDS